jgi:hypothetical protein
MRYCGKAGWYPLGRYMCILFETVELDLQTREQRQIKNELLRRDPIPGQIQQARDYRARFPQCEHRPTKASLRYNCHGLTFAARRTAITESTAVQSILIDDGYAEVDWADIVAGDVVVYLEQGDFSHSGIVVSVDRCGIVPMIWVLSKWGHAHEVVHKLHDCPYAGHPDSQIHFWRMVQ